MESHGDFLTRSSFVERVADLKLPVSTSKRMDGRLIIILYPFSQTKGTLLFLSLYMYMYISNIQNQISSRGKYDC